MSKLCGRAHLHNLNECIYCQRDELQRQLAAAQTDTARLDWLEKNKEGYGNGWLCRQSDSGRGFRLHETSRDGALPTAREAIDKAMKEGA